VFNFFNKCLTWDLNDVHVDGGLNSLIDGKQWITRKTFLKHVDRQDLRKVEDSLGYESHPIKGLTMAGESHVKYFKSKHHGEIVYGFDHSAIEYVFK
jgi:hypothetical protein